LPSLRRHRSWKLLPGFSQDAEKFALYQKSWREDGGPDGWSKSGCILNALRFTALILLSWTPAIAGAIKYGLLGFIGGFGGGIAVGAAVAIYLLYRKRRNGPTL
jgi:hypothetical protein